VSTLTAEVERAEAQRAYDERIAAAYHGKPSEAQRTYEEQVKADWANAGAKQAEYYAKKAAEDEVKHIHERIDGLFVSSIEMDERLMHVERLLIAVTLSI
jgi:hypothetical protein